MNYHNITHDDMNNGDGVRVVLWVAGCDHHCPECQNPQTWSSDSGIPFDAEAEKELFNELSKDYVTGITLSGGDPLQTNNFISMFVLLRKIRDNFPTKTIWLYTGYTFEELLDMSTKKLKNYLGLLKLIDVLVDGGYMKEFRDVQLKWRGSTNQRVIDVQKSLKENKIVLWCD